MPEGLYSSKQAAAILGLSKSHVCNIARTHDIGVRLGDATNSPRAFTAADIEALRARNTKTGPKAKKEVSDV